MTNPAERRPRRPAPNKPRPVSRGRIVVIAGVALVILALLSARSISNFYVDKLWYDSVGQSDVFWTTVLTKVGLGSAFTALFIVISQLSLLIADRVAPIDPGDGADSEIVERFRQVVGRWQALVRFIVCALFGVLIGWPAATQWQEWLLFRRGSAFGWSDPTFGRDASFYIFRLPFMTFVIDWFFIAFVMVLILTALAHVLNGGIRMVVGARSATSQVKLHISAILAVLALLKGADYWLSQFELTRSSRGFVDGVSYTEQHAQLPATRLLILVSLFAAVLLIINVRQRGFRLPVIAVGLWLIVAVVAGTLYPAGVQFFQVRPNPSSRERPFIEANIAATRFAFGLEGVGQESVDVAPVTATDVDAAEDAFNNVRILDPDIIVNAFQNEVASQGFYRFNDIDVDRYPDNNGTIRQVMVGVRSLDPEQVLSTSWEGRHVNNTHGYGVVLADAGDVQVEQSPNYINVLDDDNELGLTQPQVYFSDRLGGYAVVGTSGSVGETSPDPDAPPYAGRDGVVLGGAMRRLAFAISFGEYNLFGSKVIDDDSRIIFHRSVARRINKVAPFLSLDSDPYPIIHNGRIVWMVDAYTTTNRFPNAETADTRELRAGGDLSTQRFNYVRNSVKATVDAYDGTVTLYVVDSSDPIVRAWQDVFPELFADASAMPEGIAAHVRYPEDLFNVQTNMYGRYKISDPGSFFALKDAWSVAQEPSREQQLTTSGSTGTNTVSTIDAVAERDGRVSDADTERFEPYYSMFTPPGGGPATFALLRPFVPFSLNDSRSDLQAYMTAGSDGQLTVYEVQAEQLPNGPLQIATRLQTEFAETLTRLDQRGSRVLFGDMQLVQVGSGFVYVRPWFIESEEGKKIPRLELVTVSDQNGSASGRTIGEALRALYPGSRVRVGDQAVVVPEDPDPQDPAVTPAQLLAQSRQLFDEAQQALSTGDLGTYQDKVERAYRLAEQAAAAATGASDDGSA